MADPTGECGMRALIDAFDWGSTPLGAMEQWPQSLRTAVDLMLGCAHAMQLAWGPERTILYNDAYAPMLGGRHPAALGQPFRDTWPEIWDVIEPLVDCVFAGEAVRFEDMPLLMTRHGHPEETWWTFSYSPVRDEQGAVAGLLNVTVDTTSKMRGEQALREEFRSAEILRKLSARRVTEDNVQAIYDEILSAAIAMTGAVAGTLQILDVKTRELVVIATRGFSRGTEQHFERMDAGFDTSCGLALRSGERSHVDFDPASRDPDVLLHVGDGVLAAQSTPLLSRSGKAIGMVSTHWADSGHRLTEFESRFLDLLGRQAADLLEQWAAEKALRASEARQALLLKLSDKLAPLSDAGDIMRAASALLGTQLGVGRVGYGEVDPTGTWLTVARDWTDGRMPSAAGVHRCSDFGEDMSAAFLRGEVFGLEDVLEAVDDPRVLETYRMSGGLRASLAIPLVKQGRVVAGMYVQQGTPRKWSEDEIRLVTEVAERTWAAVERGRAENALRESEEKYRTLFDTMDEGFSVCRVVRDADGRAVDLVYIDLNRAHDRQTGIDRSAFIGRRFSEVYGTEDIGKWMSQYARVADTGEPVTFESHADFNDRWFSVSVYPRGEDDLSIFYRDISAHRKGERELRDSERFSRALVEGIPQLIWRASDGGAWTWASPQWIGFTGQAETESHGWAWLEALHPEDREVARDAWANANETGGFEVEYRIREAATGDFRWFQTRATPVRAEGRIVEWLGTSTDVNELQLLQERQQVLVGELQHRTRNLMAVVRSMAAQLGAASTDLQDFRVRFEDRLGALARVQGLLSRLGENDRITFDELIDAEMAAMDDAEGKILLDGPAGIRLRSSTLQMLAMALHELATNSLKYGALGQRSGRLEIRWRVDAASARDQPKLHIDWLERGVDMRAVGIAQVRKGQGRELIEKAMPYQMGAETSFRLGSDGLRCTMTIPVSRSNFSAATSRSG